MQPISFGSAQVAIRFALVVAVLAFAVGEAFGPPPDGVDLRVNKGPLPGQITLDWTGGQPIFDVYRAAAPQTVVDPGNYVTSMGVRTFTTGVGGGSIDFFVVTSPCVPSPPEICDGLDNDCNGTIDGPGSEASCSLPNATAGCSGGQCTVATCDVGYYNCNALAGDGCERDVASLQGDVLNCGACNNACPDPPNAGPACALGSCGLVCDVGYADCNLNAVDGCEIQPESDPLHCGACNAPCPGGANAAATCVAAACFLTCNAGFYNCDGNDGNGCERSSASLQNDSFNCGACGVTCTLPNAIGVCAGGACQSMVALCDTDYWDINGSGADGCEYFCQFSNATDLPDDAFVDANCDGIDGDVAKAVFVATTGNDAAAGTQAAPMLTVNAAIAKALATPGKTEVYISAGTYLGRVNVANGISLYGGYLASSGWSRDATNTSEIRATAAVGGRMTAVDCLGASSPTRLDRLLITTGNASGTSGMSNYAVYASGCTGLAISRSTIIAGAGGVGFAGSSQPPGAAGNSGAGGAPGSCDGPRGLGGSGGTSACGRTGGTGGPGGPEGSNNGLPGGSGVGGTPGGNGGGGGDPGSPGGGGVNAPPGAPAVDPPGGSGGGVVGGFWSGANGVTGTAGLPGNGGGGGGGGGGQGCFLCNDGGGNGGGGGGAGGCGGSGAQGGTAGGGSFGVFLVSSTGSSVINSTIQTSNGGSGGAGGAAGIGGPGGFGGPGATTCTSEVGRGGQGGNGGPGGRGGHGSGAAGGPSYAVYRSVTSVTLVGNTFLPGAGGPGGASPGNSGAPGASGSVF